MVRTAAEHSVSVHGHEDSDELREQIRGLLEDEDQFQPGTRPQEAMPG